jgi:phage shock protein PspC (stress-responsive transcriptional regulator)
MNKTISINIGGFVFNIEEDAYQKLYHYLEAVKRNFTATEECEEIMSDIESRIAEIFKSKLSPMKEVVTSKDVDDVIAVMGKPEDYATDDSGTRKEPDSSTRSQANHDQPNAEGRRKRLYRDTENGALGGVCSGLAHYLGLEVTIIRIIFLAFIFAGGISILVYVILLVAVPEAKTTNEKLNMRGQPINLDNIKEHFTKIKDDITQNTRSGKFSKSFNAAINKSVTAGATAFSSLSRILGAIFAMGGIFGLVLLMTVLFGKSGFFPVMDSTHVESLPTLLGILYPGEMESGIVFICIIVVTMIPLIAIISLGIRMLFNFKKNKAERNAASKTLAISSSILWFIAIGILAITGIDLGMNFRNEISLEYNIPYQDSSNVLFVDVSNDDIFSEHINFHRIWHETELVKVEQPTVFLGYPQLYIREQQDSGNFEIILYKNSNGLSVKDAIDKAERMIYPVTLKGNRLTLPAYFTIPVADKLRNQYPIVEIKVPSGKQVKLGNNIDRVNVSIHGENIYEYKGYSKTTWEPGHDAMRCLECKELKVDHYSDYFD